MKVLPVVKRLGSRSIRNRFGIRTVAVTSTSELLLVLGASLLLLLGVWLEQPWQTKPESLVDADTNPVRSHISRDIRNDTAQVRQKLRELNDLQASNNLTIIQDEVVQQQLSQISYDLKTSHLISARHQLNQLSGMVKVWEPKVKAAVAAKRAAPVQKVPAGAVSVTGQAPAIPILMYHYTPVNFEYQVKTLLAKGYTGITMDQVSQYLAGRGSLPHKPVVITFDDGFANQTTAFSILSRYHFPATFYIIVGGEASRWCIGAGRRYNDPLQPSSGCGDAYMNWDTIRMLDRSGLITIGGHTVNHVNLPSLPAAQQDFEISGGKKQLEAELGHPVYHFAYPYGAFNAITIDTVRRAGYTTAVTTIPGTLQPSGGQYILRRVRDAISLP